MPHSSRRPSSPTGPPPGAGLPVYARPAQRAALRILQAGAVAVVLAAVTYKAFELDRFFVPKELVLHLTALLAGLLALGAARRAQLSRVDLFLAGFLLLSAASAALAQNPWAAVRAVGISASGVVVFWTARALGRAGLARGVLVAVAVATIVGVATSLAQAYGVRIDLFSLNRAPGGTLGNRNFVAHLAAFGLPLILAVALGAWRAGGVLLGGVGVAATAATLVLTRSRAGWLAAAVVLAIFLLGWLLSPPVRRSGRGWVRLLLLLLFAGGGAAAALYLPNALRWRSENPYAETAAGLVNYQEGSGAGRLVQYRNSLEIVGEHPLLGAGPGNWPVAYPRYAAAGDPSLDRAQAGMTANPWPSSDWVAFLAERGVPATLLLMLAGASLARTGWVRLRAARDADEGVAALALLAVLAGTAVAGTFDAVLLLALPTLLVWAGVGALLAASGEPGRWTVELPVPVRALGVLVLIVVGGALVAKSAGQVAAMALFAAAEGRDDLERAARLDPGSYRIRMRLAERGRCAERLEHAEAAARLFPEAAAPERVLRRCR